MVRQHLCEMGQDNRLWPVPFVSLDRHTLTCIKDGAVWVNDAVPGNIVQHFISSGDQG